MSSFYLCNPAVAARTQPLRLLLAENVEVRQQRVAAVEQQELQQEQDEGRSDQVLELFVELLEAEGRQVAFSILLIVRTISSSPIDWLVERM